MLGGYKPTDTDLRINALWRAVECVNNADDAWSPNEIVELATKFFKFLKGESK